MQDNGPILPAPSHTCGTYLQKSYGGIGLHVVDADARSAYSGQKALIIIEYTLNDEEE